MKAKPNYWHGSLDEPLLYFGPDNPWTIRDAVQGTAIFGANGSGKTSGPGKALALAFLRAGMGGIVCTAKPDETDLWKEYARLAGRSDSVLVFAPDEKFRFDFLRYEWSRPGKGAGETQNLVRLFNNLAELEHRGDGGGGKNEGFWQRHSDRLQRNAIDVLAVAKGGISLTDIYQLLQTAPTRPDQVHDEQWQATSFCYQTINEGDSKLSRISSRRQADFGHAARYWLTDFPNIAAEERSGVVSTFTGLADRFLRGTLCDLFCTETNFVPELTHHGAVIILDLSVKEYGDVGQTAQVLFKYIWARAAERRDVDSSPRPLFLWCDEAQYFLTREDAQFAETARSSRVCPVLLSQNLPNYYKTFPGERGQQEAKSLLGLLQTKIFCANSCTVTNEWAADLIAKDWQTRTGTHTSGKSGNALDLFGGNNTGISTNQTFDYQVPPVAFTNLRQGGPQNDTKVEAIVYKPGHRWSQTGKAYTYGLFDQNLEQEMP